MKHDPPDGDLGRDHPGHAVTPQPPANPGDPATGDHRDRGRRPRGGGLASAALLGQGGLLVVTAHVAFAIGPPVLMAVAVVVLVGLVLVIWMIRRGRSDAAFAAMLAFVIGTAVVWVDGTAGACTSAHRAVVAEPNSLGEEIEIHGSIEGRCVAQVATGAAPEAVVAHYRSEFAANGFSEVRGERSNVPAARQIAAAKAGYVVELLIDEVGMHVIVYAHPAW